VALVLQADEELISHHAIFHNVGNAGDSGEADGGGFQRRSRGGESSSPEEGERGVEQDARTQPARGLSLEAVARVVADESGGSLDFRHYGVARIDARGASDA